MAYYDPKGILEKKPALDDKEDRNSRGIADQYSQQLIKAIISSKRELEEKIGRYALNALIEFQNTINDPTPISNFKVAQETIVGVVADEIFNVYLENFMKQVEKIIPLLSNITDFAAMFDSIKGAAEQYSGAVAVKEFVSLAKMSINEKVNKNNTGESIKMLKNELEVVLKNEGTQKLLDIEKEIDLLLEKAVAEGPKEERRYEIYLYSSWLKSQMHAGAKGYVEITYRDRQMEFPGTNEPLFPGLKGWDLDTVTMRDTIGAIGLQKDIEKIFGVVDLDLNKLKLRRKIIFCSASRLKEYNFNFELDENGIISGAEDRYKKDLNNKLPIIQKFGKQ